MAEKLVCLHGKLSASHFHIAAGIRLERKVDKAGASEIQNRSLPSSADDMGSPTKSQKISTQIYFGIKLYENNGYAGED